MRKLGWIAILLLACGSEDAGGPTSISDATPGADRPDAPASDPCALEDVPSLDAAPPVDAELTALDGLDIDAFFDAAFRAELRRDPEAISWLGLDAMFGTTSDRLTDVSEPYMQDTLRLLEGIQMRLRRFDRAALAPGNRISYDVYDWYLEDQLRRRDFLRSDYLVTHNLSGEPVSVLLFLRDLHPVRDRAEAEAYVARLEKLGTKLDQLTYGLFLRSEAGVILPRELIEWALVTVSGNADVSSTQSVLYTSFRNRLAPLVEASVIDADAQSELLLQARDALNAFVRPGFNRLERCLRDLQRHAPANVGVSSGVPDGRAYYAHRLRHHTTSELSADEIGATGRSEVERLEGEIRDRFEALGHDATQSLAALFAEAGRDGGTVAADSVVSTYEAIIRRAERNLAAAFDVAPSAPVVVIGGSTGGFYVAPSLDGERPGAFYAQATTSQPRFGMKTLAYHEAVPGHHFQIALAQEQELPLFRSVLTFSGYVEGWALYAERLAHELGWYAGDPYGDLGRLQAEMFRAVRLVVDTGIHTGQMSFDEATDYMVEKAGFSRSAAEGQIGRYAVWPGQAAAYYVGLRELLRLREQARTRLGDRFDLRAFHRLLLVNGSMPLTVLEALVDDYVAAQGG